MKNNRILILIFFLVVIFLGFSQLKNELSYEKYRSNLRTINSSNGNIEVFEEIYFVDNYKDDQLSESQIDSFACNRFLFLFDSLSVSGINLSFYEKTDKTNIEYLEKNPNYFHEGNFLNEEIGSIEDFLWTYTLKRDGNKTIRLKPKNYKGYKFFNDPPTCR